jgi:hypothetical protein
VRFVAAVALFSVVIGVANWHLWSQSSIWVTVIVALASGVGFAALTSYLGRVTQTALVEAVSGLDKTERSYAIDALNRGIVPGDPTVRSWATLLGTAYLATSLLISSNARSAKPGFIGVPRSVDHCLGSDELR